MSDSLTHSAMSTYKTCAKKYWLSYELGIRPIREAHYFRVGGCVHLGLEHWSKGNVDAMALATEQYNTRPEWASSTEWDAERVKVEELLRGYFDVYQTPYAGIAEQKFELPIINPATGAPTPRFTFRGKIDDIIRLEDGRLAIMEHKTTTESLEPEGDYWRKLRIDTQISGYFDAAQRLGHAVETVIFDVIRKPGMGLIQIPVLDNGEKVVVDAAGERQKNKNGTWRQSAGDGMTVIKRSETAEEYRVRLRADIAERPSFYYARQEIPRLASDLQEFREELWQIQQQIGDARRGGRWFRNTAACLAMGKCPYFDICAGGLNPETDSLDGFERVENVHQELE